MTQSNPDTGAQYAQRLRNILTFFIVLGCMALLAVIIYGLSTNSFGNCLIWTLACLVCGAAVGFLFAIPKIVQGDKSGKDDKDNQEYQLHVNTNLTEISDWLTKIIVGLGLVKLTKVPPYLKSLADAFSYGIKDVDHAVALTFAYGTICCFSVLGFLFGYLFTRLYLSKTMAIADQDSLEKWQGKMEIQFAALESKQGVLTKSLTEPASDGAALKSLEASNPNEAMAQLVKMAQEYLDIDIKDWAFRTRTKEAKADSMGLYALSHHIDSRQIYDYITKNTPTNEGLVLALATLINIDPQPGDAEKLLTTGDGLERLHVRYRVLLAIVTLSKKGYIDATNKKRAINLVESYRKKADYSQQQQIASTLSFLNS